MTALTIILKKTFQINYQDFFNISGKLSFLQDFFRHFREVMIPAFLVSPFLGKLSFLRGFLKISGKLSFLPGFLNISVKLSFLRGFLNISGKLSFLRGFLKISGKLSFLRDLIKHFKEIIIPARFFTLNDSCPRKFHSSVGSD